MLTQGCHTVSLPDTPVFAGYLDNWTQLARWC